MRHNGGMLANLRFLFSLVWFPATGAVFASGLVFILTWGGYWEYFLGSIGVWAVSTAIILIGSLE